MSYQTRHKDDLVKLLNVRDIEIRELRELILGMQRIALKFLESLPLTASSMTLENRTVFRKKMLED